MPPESETPFRRLARLLRERRTEIAPRYRNRNLFAAERGLERRMLYRVEKGDDSNYTAGTLRDVESAYALVPGSLDRTLAGGDLEPAPGVTAARAGAPPATVTALPSVPVTLDLAQDEETIVDRMFELKQAGVMSYESFRESFRSLVDINDRKRNTG